MAIKELKSVVLGSEEVNKSSIIGTFEGECADGLTNGGAQISVDLAPGMKPLYITRNGDRTYDTLSYGNAEYANIRYLLEANWKDFRQLVEGDKIEFGLDDIISVCRELSKELDRAFDEYSA